MFLSPWMVGIAVGAVLLTGVFVFLLVLLLRALVRHKREKAVWEQGRVEAKGLGETIKAHRVRCRMTQEFVAESLGVSRQAVSKWETGRSDPSSSKLFALAKLFGVSPEELLKNLGNSR
jgi:DNA-binding XRE family transcriptional regulator